MRRLPQRTLWHLCGAFAEGAFAALIVVAVVLFCGWLALRLLGVIDRDVGSVSHLTTIPAAVADGTRTSAVAVHPIPNPYTPPRP